MWTKIQYALIFWAKVHALLLCVYYTFCRISYTIIIYKIARYRVKVVRDKYFRKTERNCAG